MPLWSHATSFGTREMRATYPQASATSAQGPCHYHDRYGMQRYRNISRSTFSTIGPWNTLCRIPVPNLTEPQCTVGPQDSVTERPPRALPRCQNASSLDYNYYYDAGTSLMRVVQQRPSQSMSRAWCMGCCELMICVVHACMGRRVTQRSIRHTHKLLSVSLAHTHGGNLTPAAIGNARWLRLGTGRNL